MISGGHHVRNLSDTSGQSESSSGSILSYKSSGGGGWYETEMDSSSETLTPQRNLHQSPQLRPALLTNLTLPPKPASATAASSGQKALLPFSITPPRPPGPSKAEMKVRLLVPHCWLNFVFK